MAIELAWLATAVVDPARGIGIAGTIVNGPGDYTILFLENMPSANYACFGGILAPDSDILLYHIDVVPVDPRSCRARTSVAGVLTGIPFAVRCWCDSDTSSQAQ